MIIWIRHSNKLYKNGKGFPSHDPPLSDKGVRRLDIFKEFFFKTYGVPDLIICSPYERTRQTAEAIDGQYIIDKDISEYLGHQEIPIEVTLDTKFLGAVETFKETREDFIKRVERHVDSVIQKDDRLVLVVTHGFVLSIIADYLNKSNRKKHFKELEGIVYDKGKLTEYIEFL